MAETTKRQQSGNRKPGRPKGSTSKKTGTSSKSRRTTGKKAYEQDNTEFMRAEVVIICSFAVAILLFLSNFKLCGVVGDVLRGVQLGIFGIVGYIFPILIFVGTCFHLSNQGNIHAAMKLAVVAGAVITVCGLLQLAFGTVPAGAKWMEYYKQSTLTGTGGGWLGGVLTSFLTIGLGKPGTFLVLVVRVHHLYGMYHGAFLCVRCEAGRGQGLSVCQGRYGPPQGAACHTGGGTQTHSRGAESAGR